MIVLRKGQKFSRSTKRIQKVEKFPNIAKSFGEHQAQMSNTYFLEVSSSLKKYLTTCSEAPEYFPGTSV